MGTAQRMVELPMRCNSRKLIFFVAVDWFFCSHFMERAKAARNAGYEVIVVTSIENHRWDIENAGLRIIDLGIDRRSLSLFSAIGTIKQLISVLRKENPDILHQVAIKPILLGGVAARIAGVRRIVNAVVGGGYAYTSTAPFMRVLRPLIEVALKLLLNPQRSRVIFENRDDMASFIGARQARPEAAVLIRGAGVDFNLYSERSAPNVIPLVMLPARLLWEKGLGEFVAAARLLRNRNVKARFAIVGNEDIGNRGSIPVSVLTQWKAEEIVELWGFRSNMPQVLRDADIVCLPSYREGLPKALLEGMAAGLPCVTTNVPGCREAVIDGENGLLVPPKDYLSLANALQQLILNPALRLMMGNRGRVMAETEFASSIICLQTLQVYEDLLQS